MTGKKKLACGGKVKRMASGGMVQQAREDLGTRRQTIDRAEEAAVAGKAPPPARTPPPPTPTKPKAEPPKPGVISRIRETLGLKGGGKVHGKGTSTSDSVPALLSKGEYVVKAKSAKKIGYGAMEHMNQTGRVPMKRGGKCR